MTIDQKMIPPEVVEAAAKAFAIRRLDADMWSIMDEQMRVFYRQDARAALTAGLAAWPGADLMPFGDGVTRIRLPLLREASDDQ